METILNRKRERENSEVDPHDTDFLISIKVNKIENELKSNTEHWAKSQNENLNAITNDKKYSFGNYDQYYYKRFLLALQDELIGVLKKEYFYNKKCLDIGCNDGTLTLLLAVEYQPKLIEGIDIDYKLIKHAIKNMKYVMRNNLSKAYINNLIIAEKSGDDNIVEQILTKDMGVDYTSLENHNLLDKIKEKLNTGRTNDILNKMYNMPKSMLLNLNIDLEKTNKLQIIKNDKNDYFPNNILFKQENYVSDLKQTSGSFDTILCLSTSKWIHLNYGDFGVKILFHNIYNQLKEGGLFIFEYQCWKSYKKRKDLNKRINENYKNINFKPEDFRDYLEKTYNFKLIETTYPPSNSKKTYTRPIYIFKK